MNARTTIETTDDYQPDAAGQAERWTAEMAAAERDAGDWLKDAQKLVDRYTDKRKQRESTRLNLFASNVQTVRAMLYGQMPAIECKRRFDDPGDDVARVAATMLQRLLNHDMERDEDAYTDVLRYCLDDRLVVGLGCARVRYEVEHEDIEHEPQVGEDGRELVEAYTESRMVHEDACVDYVHWRDVRWSPARTWGEVRWVAFRAYMTRDQVKARFGQDVARAVPYGGETKRASDKGDAANADAWKRCEVWEIWCRESRSVYWWVKGHDRVLDQRPDPLELTGFFPCPKFLVANQSTSSLMPVPDFHLARDLYNEIDYVSTRIERLERSIKAVGVYDASASGVQRMMQEGTVNELIPVESWAAFAEKGGIKGSIDWLPILDLVNALDKLREYRRELIELLYQVTGYNDIMRGAASTPNVTATEQGLKARFASVRVNALQDQFADFASQLQQLRAEVIIRHFADETIVQRSNIGASYDARLVPQALQLLRSEFAAYRIQIEPDSIARADYAAMQNDRTALLMAVGQFVNQALPLAQSSPEAAPALVELIRWTAAGFRGATQVESVLDQMLTSLQRSQAQGQGGKKDPEADKAMARMREQQMKGQQRMAEIKAKAEADMAKLQAEMQRDLAKAQAELDMDQRREWNQAQANVSEEAQKAQIRMREKATVAQLTPIGPRAAQ